MVTDVISNKIIEYCGNICFIPTKYYFSIKCGNFLTANDYKEEYLDFIFKKGKKTI